MIIFPHFQLVVNWEFNCNKNLNVGKEDREMPKVVTSRRKPPAGWEEIEETLEEFDQRLREGS
jgi:hypothetical protein